MPEAYLRRGTAIAPNQTSKPNANPIFVDSADEALGTGTGTSGTAIRKVPGGLPLSLSADGAITIATSLLKITKAGVAALTLAAPTAAQEGTRLDIISNTANAHTITATSLIDDGVTGGSKTTATFAAFAGAAISLVAINLKWSVLAKNAVTIT